jgi:hypothetical protein
VLGDVEEVLALDVLVALGVAGIQRGEVDGRGCGRLQRILRGDDLPLELGEVPAHLADH